MVMNVTLKPLYRMTKVRKNSLTTDAIDIHFNKERHDAQTQMRHVFCFARKRPHVSPDKAPGRDMSYNVIHNAERPWGRPASRGARGCSRQAARLALARQRHQR